MSVYTIDRWGFLRRDGRIIGWSLRDLLWARRKPAPAQNDEAVKIAAALHARGLELHPVPDGGGAWHYEVRDAAPVQENKP